MSLLSTLFRTAFFILVALVAGRAAASTQIDLVIDEATQNRKVAWPVTTGVPFPRGALTDDDHCTLVDDTGAERPLQTKVAATWDADRKSIRWLTIDFIAHPGRKYALLFGPEVLRERFHPGLNVAYAGDSRAANHAVVSTGPLEVSFSPRAPQLLDSIKLDLNGDGAFAASERIAYGAKEGEHRYIDADGRVSSSAHDGKDRQIIVEATGPVRACIRVDGWYTDPDGRRTVAYRTRYHLFAGLSLMKVIDEFRIIGSTRDLRFKDIALPLELELGGDVRSVATTEGTFGAAAPHEVSAVQATYRHYGNPECRGYVVERVGGEERIAQSAERVGPWMQITGSRAVVTGSLRNFSQQFPKEWHAAKNRLTLHLWSPRVEQPLDFGQPGIERFFGDAGRKYLFDWKSGGGSSPITDFFFYAGHTALKRDGADGRGINKHHEIWYHFARTGEAAAGREYGALADKPPIALATGKWNVATDVFGPLAARPNDSPYEAIVDRIFDLERKAQDDFGDYGWYLFGAGPHYSYQWDKETQKHYADPRRFEYHTYQRETQLWWTYLRSGERKFFDWCLPSEDHWVDIAVSHVPTMYSTEWRGGKRGAARLHYPAGDWSIDSPLHYVRHHDTGEAWLRSASQYWGTYHRTLESTTLAYYLTGDERYNDVVKFWKEYWGALAGIRSDSTDAKLWHEDQMWWAPTEPGKPSKSWAEMIRDYAPFQSGSRHQQTLFFNLSTLYEHTWDPTVKQVLDEYAAAFIKPENPNGVWQCQDHHLPAHADSPLLAHYWSPALWKYARASGDKRMPDVLKKYFTACLDADPYGGDVGIYSNNQIAWAWHFTRDPRSITAAKHELERLRPNAEPLAKPEDLGHRIYNPYAAISCMAAVPRLVAVTQDSLRQSSAKPPLLEPQRTLIAIRTEADCNGVLWGWDPTVRIYDAQGNLQPITKVRTQRSHRQPFDRNLKGFEVFQTEFERAPKVAQRTPAPASPSPPPPGPVKLPAELPIPASAGSGAPIFAMGTDVSAWLFLSPTVETGILRMSGEESAVYCWAGEPVKIRPQQPWYWPRYYPRYTQLTIEAARPNLLKVTGDPAFALQTKIEKNRLIVSLGGAGENRLITIESTDGEQWFRIVEMPDDVCWVTPKKPKGKPPQFVLPKLYEQRRAPALEVNGALTAGKFGKALHVAGGSEFEIPDEVTAADGTKQRISDARQGSLEFWIRRLTDERLQQVPRTTIFYAGPIQMAMPQHVPLDEWSHIAVDWYPALDDPEQVIASVYVDGVDHGNYRSIYWAGYGDRVPSFAPTKTPWLGKWKITAPTGTAYVLDDVRLSSKPRYTDVATPFGRAQTFNPKSFTPPTKPVELDAASLWIAPLDAAELEARTKSEPLKITRVRSGRKP